MPRSSWFMFALNWLRIEALGIKSLPTEIHPKAGNAERVLRGFIIISINELFWRKVLECRSSYNCTTLIIVALLLVKELINMTTTELDFALSASPTRSHHFCVKNQIKSTKSQIQLHKSEKLTNSNLMEINSFWKPKNWLDFPIKVANHSEIGVSSSRT